ncbi:uncharacterized protein PHACADRAFT_32829 [Phanerochaete carnosa HHB-10118-sp]|uniref:F-box domain-containing protein n=1 Tax=Phanerochaete carnosa (strain HHB-10118-sp) TaxID=650164 RepID=K5VFM5_PHACS|nr:uncharacterized protein PHACADRAFT_32829 [Phanerochaete carnosa HHB-10118-sp]EKM49968.1 hypothetical protein PHACADRAFT_32829 [Phanerochaete carnosa HHB-10118-sp]
MPRRTTRSKTGDDAGAARAELPVRSLAGRKRKRLEDLPNMPLDIVVEVNNSLASHLTLRTHFSAKILLYLEPLDLLHLARTSKAFRAVLMNRSNAFLWRTARQNVEDLPECPSGSCEPAYANFLFCTYCHECSKPNSQHIYWDLMARYCRQCETRLHKWADKVCLDSVIHRAHHVWRIFSSMKLERDIQDVDPCDLLRMWSKRPVNRHDSYYMIRNHYGYILESDYRRMQGILSAMTLQERTGYIAMQVHYLAKWRELVPTLVRWFRSKQNARKAELDVARKARQQQCVSGMAIVFALTAYHALMLRICQRLAVLGWQDELEAMSQDVRTKLFSLPVAQQPKELTDRVWEKIAPPLLEFMEQVKQERLRQEHLGALKERFTIFDRVLPARYSYRPGEPSELDIALGISQLREVIDSPSEATVDEGSFDFLQEALPPFVENWKNERDSRLAALVTQDLEDIDPSADPLTLAVACRFTCKACGSASAHPQTHRCRCVSPTTEQDDVYCNAAVKSLAKQYWTPSTFETNVSRLSSIIRICGYDPARTTLEDLEGSAVRLACKSCDPEAGALVMTWFAAFRHLLSEHDEEFHAAAKSLYVVSERHADVARELERAYVKHSHTRWATSPPWWQCGSCSQKTSTTRTDRTAIVRHLRKKHNVERPKENRDFWHEDERVRTRNPREAQVYLLQGSSMTSILDLPHEQQTAVQNGYGQFCDFL